MAINLCITNDMARVLARIAERHPDCSVEIVWNEGTAENLWQVTASNGVEDTIYCVDDEAGHWMPMTAEEADSMARGGFMHASGA